MKEVVIDNITYRVGRNAADNTQLIKDSNRQWTWFHLDKFPSCHVVVCSSELDERIVLNAAGLVKEHSKYKFKNIGINYCKIDNLRQGLVSGSVSFISIRKVTLIHV